MADSFTFLSFFLPLSLFLLSHLAFPLPVQEPTAPEPNPSRLQFDCGNLTEIKYPFFGITGHVYGLWAIYCENGMKPTIKFEGEGRSYVVKEILYEESTLVIQDEEISNHSPSDLCNFHYNFTMPPSPIHPLYLNAPNYTFVNCKGDHQPLFNHSYKGVYNYRGCEDRIIYYWPEDLPLLHDLSPLQLRHCSVTHFPLSLYLVDPDVPNDLFSLLDLGFDLQWNRTQECTECQKEKGVCSRNPSTGDVDCFRTPWVVQTPLAQLPWYNSAEPVHLGEKRTKIKKILIAVGAMLGGFLLTSLILILRPGFLFLLIRTKNWKKKTDNAGNVGGVEEFLEIYGSLALRRYTYSDLKKITNSFKDSLGQGGYGGVFKGMLQDGRLVAVKVLNESKGNGEDFINEVSSIGRTYHVNIVSLLGFCSEGSKRALIYEFMPNGSLEKFIYTEKPRQSHPLGWEKLYQIAIGVARGLEYLHRGCNTRILHFDIKPHNILLDQDFCPKISDFGLAKLCPTQNSTISMLGARGTVGFIAPEVYCRSIGGISHKSDVYSYGMMVLEMVGGRKNIDPLVENTSEVGLLADREQHIHRLGRTGWKGKEGKGLLLLAPWEEFFLSSVRDFPLTKASLPPIDPDIQKKHSYYFVGGFFAMDDILPFCG